VEDRILTYLSRRPATPEQLERSLEADAADIRKVVDKLEATGWVTVMPAWFGSDPASAITVISLTRAGRQEDAPFCVLDQGAVQEFHKRNPHLQDLQPEDRLLATLGAGSRALR
jgi:hypothetical protein